VIEDLGFAALGSKVYKRDLDFRRYNVPFLLQPYISSTRAGAARAMHVLFVAANATRAIAGVCAPPTILSTNAAGRSKNFTGLKEILSSDDDTFNYQKARHHRVVLQAQEFEFYVELQRRASRRTTTR